jgi:peptidyl-prolyl cis-trans isomerase A (cyclophilin A)
MVILGKLAAVLTLCAGKLPRKLGTQGGSAVEGIGSRTTAVILHRIFTSSCAVIAVTLLAAVVGCGKGSSNPSAATQEPGPATGSSSSRPTPKRVDVEKPVVRIETSLGGITIRLDRTKAPGTVYNFLSYANDKFYDNTLVHYVDPGKMIVAGGYGADRKPKPGLLAIRNEAHNGLKNVRGTIAMARDRDRIDSATSQFFFNLADAPTRDHQSDSPSEYGYCVFGEITDGLDVADKISQSPTADQGGDLAQTPDPPVVIKSVRVVQ